MAEKVANSEFEALLEQLKQSRGFDFTGYKRPTLMRRVQKRMSEIGISDFTAYGDFLETHPSEFRTLFNTILINVTSFFRDPEAWEALAQKVIAPWAADEDRPVRVWSAGCATGEETYTLVMMLAEAFGIDRFKKSVKVYATDADGEALAFARQARYTGKQLETVPSELRTKYFEPVNNQFVFRADLRRCVIFGEHDLVQDAPISRIDLLVCRNTLIYFNAETQARILARFHFGLMNQGYVFLGKSEMLLTHSRLFHAVDVRARIFQKLSKASLRDRLLLLAQAGTEMVSGLSEPVDLRAASFDAGPIAQVVVDRSGVVILANQQARGAFRIAPGDVGRTIQDLEISYRPVEIRSRIEQAYVTRAPVELTDVEHQSPGGECQYFDVKISPLTDGSDAVGVSIAYVDVTAHHRLRQDLERSSREVEVASEELQATNEELETTNEELQSTIEELETTNEELQSTNEELETMNEELHSTNEELETINEELRRRTFELNTTNEFMEAIMTSMRAGVVVTDQDMHIMLWNAKAEDLWGLRQEEVEGKVLTNLDIGLPLDQLARPLRACLEGRDFSQMVDAVTRRGKTITARVAGSRLATADNRLRGLILVMEEWNGAPE